MAVASGADRADPPTTSGAADSVDRRQLWAWTWQRVRPYVGWVLALLGGVALFLGWYGVSGEALTAKQLPYLVSGGLTGIGLLILAGIFLATDDIGRRLAKVDELERKVDELHALFAAELTADAVTAAEPPARPATGATVGAAPVISAQLVALPGGVSYHRPGCALVAGKAEAGPVDAATVRSRKLRPCRVCDPDPST
jgi:hypothetical protein